MSPKVKIARLQTEVNFLNRVAREADDPNVKKLYDRLISLVTNRIEVLKASLTEAQEK